MSRIEQINAMLAENPSDSFLQHALGLEYIKVGDDNTAQHIFETLLTSNPDYVGSYYHLAKVFERLGAESDAIAIYEKGMETAKKMNDNHAYNELKSAYEFLIF